MREPTPRTWVSSSSSSSSVLNVHIRSSSQPAPTVAHDESHVREAELARARGMARGTPPCFAFGRGGLNHKSTELNLDTGGPPSSRLPTTARPSGCCGVMRRAVLAQSAIRWHALWSPQSRAAPDDTLPCRRQPLQQTKSGQPELRQTSRLGPVGI